MSIPGRSVSVLCVLALGGAVGCKGDTSGGSSTVARAEPSSSSAPTPSAVASVPAEAPRKVPSMVLTSPGPAFASVRVYPVDGAVLVAEERRVGRIVDDGIEWLGKIPAGLPTFGGTTITSVQGRYPDAIDVLYMNKNGRAADPSYFPLTGKGREAEFGPGGSSGYIVGIIYAGASTVVAGWGVADGHRLVTVRGPALSRPLMSEAEAGCEPGEIHGDFPSPGIQPAQVGGTPGGVVLSIGNRCNTRGLAAEIWEKNGPSRMVDLAKQMPAFSDLEAILRGRGEELFVVAGSRNPVLRFDGHAFEPLPPLAKPMRNVVVSQSGQLHVSDGETIHRLEGGAWVPVARLSWPVRFEGMAVDGETIWVGSGNAVWKLREGPGATYTEGCTTPFVYLYDVSWKNDAKFTYPATQKGLAAFPDVTSLSLFEVNEAGVRRLGIAVASKEQGEAVLAHLHTTMKDEDPKLLCYAPKGGRKIPLKGSGK